MTDPSSLTGKIALVTGAARGQGRSHAVRLAQAGADVIALDICDQIPTVKYPMSTPADLAQTVKEVEALDRRIEAAQVDVRDSAALQAAVDAAADRLGGIDIVVANAGIAPGGGAGPDPERMFRDIVDVNLVGVWNTVRATAPRMIAQDRGGAIVLISSTQGLTGRGGQGDAGLDGYCASKHAVVGLMRTFSHWLAPHRIRVNTVHPTGVDTPMVNNEELRDFYGERPSMRDAMKNLLDVELLEPVDISNAVAWLVSDAARYVAGVTLPVDAGFAVR